jgi:hypothetical protein
MMGVVWGLVIVFDFQPISGWKSITGGWVCEKPDRYFKLI